MTALARNGCAPLSVLVPLAIIAALGLIGVGVVLGQMLTLEGPPACPWVMR